jgi:hypothetical protein
VARARASHREAIRASFGGGIRGRCPLPATVRRFHPQEGLAIAGAVLISGVYNVYLEKLARNQFGVLSPDPRNEPYYGSNFDHYKSMSTI